MVLDKQDYINKAQDPFGMKLHLQDLRSRPNKQTQTCQHTQECQGRGRFRVQHEQKTFTQQAQPPKASQNLQNRCPLRPIVSNRGAVTYGVTKELVKIFRLLVGHSPHHIKNTQVFVEQVKSIRLEEGECFISYYVKALFTSIPVDPAISIIKHKLQQDTDPWNRISISIQHITIFTFTVLPTI